MDWRIPEAKNLWMELTLNSEKPTVLLLPFKDFWPGNRWWIDNENWGTIALPNQQSTTWLYIEIHSLKQSSLFCYTPWTTRPEINIKFHCWLLLLSLIKCGLISLVFPIYFPTSSAVVYLCVWLCLGDMITLVCLACFAETRIKYWPPSCRLQCAW